MAIPATYRRPFKLWKLKRQPAGLLLFLSIAFVFIIAALIFALASRLLGPESPTNDMWGHLAVSISVFTFALTIVGGLSVLIQISEANESRNLDLYRDIYEKLMSNDAIEARRFIYQNFPDFAPPDNAEARAAIVRFVSDNQEARDRMKQVLNLLDYFGFLIVEQEWMTADEVIDWLSPVVAKLWLKIGPVVMYERAQRPEEPDYYQAAVNLAVQCQLWRAGHYPERARVSFDSHRI